MRHLLHLLHLLWCSGCRSGRTYWIPGEGCTPRRLRRLSIADTIETGGRDAVA